MRMSIDVRRVLRGLGDRFGAAGYRGSYGVSKTGKGLAQVFGCDLFIFDDENACRHFVFPAPATRASTEGDATCDSKGFRVIQRRDAARRAPA